LPAGGVEAGSTHSAAPGLEGAGAGGAIGVVTGGVPPDGGEVRLRRISRRVTTNSTRTMISRINQPTVSPLPAPSSSLRTDGCALMVIAVIPEQNPPRQELP
jgi:hypothetical protein